MSGQQGPAHSLYTLQQTKDPYPDIITQLPKTLCFCVCCAEDSLVAEEVRPISVPWPLRGTPCGKHGSQIARTSILVEIMVRCAFCFCAPSRMWSRADLFARVDVPSQIVHSLQQSEHEFYVCHFGRFVVKKSYVLLP